MPFETVASQRTFRMVDWIGVGETQNHGTLIVLLASTLTLLLVVISAIVRRIRFVRSLTSVPGPPALPILGNALILTGGQDDFFRLLQRCAIQFGECFVLWVGQRPFIFLQSAEAIQPILSSTLHIDKSYEYKFFFPWLGSGLVTSTGCKWHNRRKLLTPCFHSKVLIDFVAPAQRCARVFVNRLALAAEAGKPVDVLMYAKRCTLDMLCAADDFSFTIRRFLETTMGYHANIQLEENSEYNDAITELSSILQRRFITPWLKPDIIFNATSFGRRHKRCVRTIHAFTDHVIEERRKELKQRLKCNGNFDVTNGNVKAKPRLALLDFLLEMHLKCKADESALSDEDIRDEVNTFLFAGYDTTAAGMSWCLYILGHYPEVQEQLVEEIRAAKAKLCTEKDWTHRSLQLAMPLLDSCLRESMRLFPQVPLIARDIKHTVNIGSHTLPAGVTVLMNLYLLHRDPRFFPEPERFIADRFLHQTEGSHHPFAYIPFSAGPRNCIGQKFAILQLKILLIEVLLNFEICSETPLEKLNLVGELVLVNKEGLNLWFKPRQC